MPIFGMASLRRIPGRKVWIACFTDADGKRFQRSTGTRDQKEARKIAEDFESAARKQRTSSQVRRVIHDIHERITGEELSDTTVREFFDRYVESRKPELSKSSFDKYSGVRDEFIESLKEKADRPIVFVTKADISAYRDSVAARLKTSTANGKLKIVKVFFRQAKRDGFILDNIAEDVPILKVRDQDVERMPFTREQISAILERSDGEMRGIILFGYYTGLRLSDICKLTWDKVDAVTGELNVKTVKTLRRQIIPLAPELVDWLLLQDGVDDPKSPIFPESRQSVLTSGRSSTVSHRFAEILAGLGLREKVSHGSKNKGRSSKREMNELSFHSLRHSLTSHLKEAGVSEAIAMEIVGHDSAAMSRHYTKVDNEVLRDAIKRIGGVNDA